MSIFYSVEHKAQLAVQLKTGVPDAEVGEIIEGFNIMVEQVIKNHNGVSIDDNYKRFGLDIGFTSNSKESLSEACSAIVKRINSHHALKDIDLSNKN